jgi:hypothetical protein
MWTLGFRHGVIVDCAPLGMYVGTMVPTFRDGLSVPVFKGPVGCPEASVSCCQPTPCNISEELRPHGNLRSATLVVTTEVICGEGTTGDVFLAQGCTKFPQVQELLQNIRRRMLDMK